MPNYNPTNPIPATGVCTVTELALSGASQTLVAANVGRWRLILINQSLANLAFFGLDGNAAVANRGLPLSFLAAAGGGNHLWDSGTGPVPTNAITVIGTAGQRVTAIEFFSDL